MAHNLFGERFIERQGAGRVRAWHNLGQTFDAGLQLSAQDAVRNAGMTYRIRKFPLVADMTPRNEDGTIKTRRVNGTEQEAPVNMTTIPGQFAIVREPVAEDNEPRFFGQVGKDYTLLQNMELAELIDRIATGYTVETVGALGMGETVFFALSAGRWDIRGDEIEDYLLISDTRDGSGGMVFCMTPVRVVCQNTLNMAMGSNSDRVSLTHSAAVRAEASELLSIMNRMKEIRAEQQEALTALTTVKVTTDMAKAMIETFYPEPQKPAKVRLAEAAGGEKVAPALMSGLKAWEGACENVKVFRAKTEDLFDVFNAEHTQFAETGYALFNAVTEHEDHYRRGRNDRTRAESAVFGDRALLKARAFSSIAELVG